MKVSDDEIGLVNVPLGVRCIQILIHLKTWKECRNLFLLWRTFENTLSTDYMNVRVSSYIKDVENVW